ncbi:MAG: hypothetical protein JXA37_03665 [Chloroflexia bacterium]|nr:hypothetical protein [Chloroflexia bacterium]
MWRKTLPILLITMLLLSLALFLAACETAGTPQPTTTPGGQPPQATKAQTAAPALDTPSTGEGYPTLPPKVDAYPTP